MSDADRARWDARYAREGLVMGPRPKSLVLELAPALPRTGRALDIACGEGQLAIWLAQRGMQVTAVDVAPKGLEKLRARAAELGLTDRIEVVEADLDHGLPEISGPLDLVACVDFYSPPIVAQARRLLAPAGLLLVELVLQPPGGDSPHRAPPGAALEFAAGLRVQFYREGIIKERALAQLLAQQAPAETLPFSG